MLGEVANPLKSQRLKKLLDKIIKKFYTGNRQREQPYKIYQRSVKMGYITVYKYLLRDLETMNKAGYTYAAQGYFPKAPKGTFVSKIVDTHSLREELFNADEGTFRQAKTETE